MHTTEHDGYTVHHNGDYSGDVIVVLPDQKRDRFGDEPVKIRSREENGLVVERWFEVTLPFDLLERLVADKLRDEMIGRLEQADTGELLTRLIS